MNYDNISRAAQQLTYREKLKLAQLLIELALQDDEQNLNQPPESVTSNFLANISV